MDLEETLRSIALPLLRFASFAGSAIVFGLAPVLLLVLRPTFSSLSEEGWVKARRRVAIRLEGLVWAGLAATAAATTIVLVLQAALVSELRTGRVDSGAFESVFETTFGQWYAVRYPLLLGLAILLYRGVAERSLAGAGESKRAPNFVWWGVWLFLGATLLATSSFSGHAAAASPRYFGVANDIVHLCAGATWFAGIVILAVILPDAWRRADLPDRLEVLAPAVTRFSRVALTTIAIVAATGTLNSFLHLGAFEDLVGSGYGRTLLVKLGAFGLVLILGAINHWFIARRLERAQATSEPTGSANLFRRTIAAELAAALAIMVVTGVLVGLPSTRSTSSPASIENGGGAPSAGPTP
ncbi:MAG: CopD family protein [Actinomycetota bacterium]|nr:CopD family protein [Actinomycetota bacterium]